MRERAPRNLLEDPDRIVGSGWTYMHHFKGKPLPGITMPDGPTTGGHLYHLEHIARLLPWFSFLTGDSSHFDAFMESYEAKTSIRRASYWEGVAIFLYLPWLQDRLWNARLTKEGVVVDPVYLGERTPRTGSIATPDGPIPLTWVAPNKLDVPPDASCVIAGDAHP